MATIEQFIEWVERDLRRAVSDLDFQYVDTGNGRHLSLWIYTDRNRYSLSAHEGERSYLGAGASSRKPRAGEDWTRGNDLHDGPLDENTWRRILGDIVAYEMVKIHKFRDNRTPPAEICPADGAHGHLPR